MVDYISEEDDGEETELKEWQGFLASLFWYGAIALTGFNVTALVVGYLFLDSIILLVGGLSIVFFFSVPLMIFSWVVYAIYRVVYAKGPSSVPVRSGNDSDIFRFVL